MSVSLVVTAISPLVPYASPALQSRRPWADDARAASDGIAARGQTPSPASVSAPVVDARAVSDGGSAAAGGRPASGTSSINATVARCAGLAPDCPSWFLNPPFEPVEPFTGGKWVQLSTAGIKAAEPLFDFGPNECPKASSPCCAGMSHSGGGHQFGPCAHVMPAAYNLRARRSDGTFFPASLGRDLLLALDGRTMLMLGDSVVHQRFLAIECAARRAGCARVSFEKKKTFPPEGAKCHHWRKGVHYIDDVTVSCAPGHSARLLYGRQYQPCVDGDVEKAPPPHYWNTREQRLLDAYKPDVVIFSTLGAHYEQCLGGDRSPKKARAHSVAVYASELFRKWVADPNVVVAYSEGTPGHKASPGGEYCPGQSKPKGNGKITNAALLRPGLDQAAFERLGGSFGCFPVAWGANTQRNWSGKLTRQVLEELNFTVAPEGATAACLPSSGTVLWVPFEKLAQSRPDMHPVIRTDDGVGVRACRDSVHICYSPLFWEPYIASLHNVLRKDGVCSGDLT